MNLYGTKARYERHYLNGIMYLAKGDLALASNYLNLALKGMKEQLSFVDYDEGVELKESMIQLADVLKDIGGCRNKEIEKEITKKRSAVNEEEGKCFASKKKDIPGVCFDDVIGLEEVKAQIFDMVINPVKFAKLYKRFDKKAGGGIIMYGPPGNGKTMIAKAIAHETGATFFPIKFSDLGSKWFGETEENIRKLFDEARGEKSAVIFFDEIDAIAPTRNGDTTTSRVVAELLAQMDGITKSGSKLTIIAATNRIEDIDSAILRPGRFDEKIFIPLPDERGRTAMFKARLRAIPCNITKFSELAKECDGFSGADVEQACEKAKQAVIRSIIAGAPEDTEISKQNVLDAIREVRASKNELVELCEQTPFKIDRQIYRKCMEA